ncbi:YlzJ-like family protein [Gorillibacterium sp. CAU 1737]|uniref:YlzJ-like family protein n=1 Tax=Gorillibacterium sp. CAU 1737 TaxID=3140362 RepID=UPI0032612154
MTLYTVLPLEHVLAGVEEMDYAFEDVVINGISMQVEFLGATRARIVRLYSADLADYLNPRYSPGSIIRYQPVRESD